MADATVTTMGVDAVGLLSFSYSAAAAVAIAALVYLATAAAITDAALSSG